MKIPEGQRVRAITQPIVDHLSSELSCDEKKEFAEALESLYSAWSKSCSMEQMANFRKACNSRHYSLAVQILLVK